jgi:hypothetical protein
VKAVKEGRLRSLKQFMEEKHSTMGVIISQAPLEKKGKRLPIPFYLLSHLPRLVQYFGEN